jgi:hypothetical protein
MVARTLAELRQEYKPYDTLPAFHQGFAAYGHRYEYKNLSLLKIQFAANEGGDSTVLPRPSQPFFFEGAPQSSARPQIVGEAPSPTYLTEFLATSDGLALVNAFRRIKTVSVKRSIVRLVEELTDDE